MLKQKAAVLAVGVLAVVLAGVVPALAGSYFAPIGNVTGYLTPGEVDTWTIDLDAGTRYNVQLTVPHDDDFDFLVWHWEFRYGEWEQVVDTVGLEGTGVDESEYFTATRSTTYHIIVESYHGRGTYTLTIREKFYY